MTETEAGTVRKARDLLEEALDPDTADPWVKVDRAKDLLDDAVDE